jgi:peptide/nickel transport system substrate-binding protein
MMRRRDFLKTALGSGAMLLLAACGSQQPAAPAATLPPSGQAAPAKPAEAAKPAESKPAEAAKPAAPAGAAPTQAAPASASKPVGAGGTITFALENDVIDFDPLRSRAFVDRNAHYQIYDSLVTADNTGKVIPWLAEKWETSADGKTVTFSLKKGVKFHDGTDFDAESVKWNVDRYRLTDDSARKGELAPLEDVQVVDASTVKFLLKSPFTPLLSILVDRAGMMVSKKAVEAGGADFTRKAFKAGTGPFVLTEAVKDDHITLEKNPDWWGKAQDGSKIPYIDKIIIKPITSGDVRLTNLKTGDAQIMNNVSPKDVAGVKNESSLTYQDTPGVNWGSLVPNSKDGFVFADHRYIKAVSMAIDRKEIIDKVFFGLGTVGYGTIAPSHFAYDANFKPFEKPDIDGAKKLVAEVGKGALSFELLVSAGDPFNVQLASIFQAQLKKADINVEIKQLEFAQILKLQQEHTFTGLTQIGWSGRIDPDPNTADFLVSGRPNNDSSYKNADVDKLLTDQRTEGDQEKRKDLLRKAEQIYVVDDPARIWYRFGPSQLLTSNRISGLQPYPDQIIRFQYASMKS